jgi:hypothetical protein
MGEEIVHIVAVLVTVAALIAVAVGLGSGVGWLAFVGFVVGVVAFCVAGATFDPY